MKKYLALLAAMLFVLSFTAIAFAQTPTGTQAVVSQGDTQINLSGFIGFRGTYFKNIDLDDRDGDKDGNGAYSEMVYGLKVEATTGKVKGVIEFYSADNGYSGMQFGGDFRDAKSGPYVRQLYIQFPVGPLTASVGHQLGMLGIGSYVDFSSEGADMILVSYPFGKNAIGLGTIKIAEGGTTDLSSSTAKNTDIDVYFVTGDFDLNGHMLGINVSQVHNQSTTAQGTGAAVAKGSETINNFGLTLKGKIGQVGYLLAGDKQSGDDAAASKNKYKGYHWRAAANFAATDMITLSAASIYYSGEKGTATDQKMEGFVNFLENKDYATFIYGYILRGPTAATPLAGLTTSGAGYGAGTPNPAGAWFNRVAIDMKLMKDLKAQLAYINIRGTYKQNANTSSKKIGNEIDAKIDYDLAKNLTYTVTGGYFMPGKAWERTSYKYDEEAYAIRHAVVYKF